MSANCLPACNWEDINIMRNVYQRVTKYRYRKRTGCLFTWLPTRPTVRVGPKLCRCPGCILMLLSLMIIETQRFYAPLLPGNKTERCEQKWMLSYCSLKILIVNILCECVTVRRRRGHRALVDVCGWTVLVFNFRNCPKPQRSSSKSPIHSVIRTLRHTEGYIYIHFNNIVNW